MVKQLLTFAAACAAFVCANAQTSTENLVVAETDKTPVTGTCYTAGENQEMTNSEKDGYVKIRTGYNGSTFTVTVNSGYVITGMTVEGFSNNTTTEKDASIYCTGAYVDGSTTSILADKFTFAGGSAGQTPATMELKDISASSKIVLEFDNKNIDGSANCKNKQLMVKMTFTYTTAGSGTGEETAISEVEAGATNGACYNISGQRVGENEKGLVIRDGKLTIKK